MLGGREVERLIEMYQNGMSISAIARELDCDRKTVRKWLKQGGFRPRKPRSRRPSKLDPHKEYIMKRLADGVFNAEVLLRELRQRGYAGGRSILNDLLFAFRQQQKVKATLRFETPPGEQAQVDWGECGFIVEDGLKHKLYCFTMVLGYSRMLYVEFTTRQHIDALILCIIHAFRFFGGLPRVLLTDNMKQVVTGHEADGTPCWNTRFLDFSRHYGLKIRLCRPRRARTKGKVESGVGYVKQNFLPGVLAVSSLDDLNAQVRVWLSEVANCRPHGTTHQPPVERFRDENLIPLHLVSEFDTSSYLNRRVSSDCFVDVHTNRYSVPWQYAGRDVRVRLLETRMEVQWGGTVVAEHDLVQGRFQVISNPDHLKGIPLDDGRSRRSGRLLVAAPEVEVRPLSVYEAVAGVGGR